MFSNKCRLLFVMILKIYMSYLTYFVEGQENGVRQPITRLLKLLNTETYSQLEPCICDQEVYFTTTHTSKISWPKTVC